MTPPRSPARETTAPPSADAAPTRAHPGRVPRADGEGARERLLQAGLRLFADQGFAKTSTRELAEAAQVNVAAISYYFGDKAGLYRAVFFEPLSAPPDGPPPWALPGMPLHSLLHGFYAELLEPLRQGEAARLCIKLHFREMLEPTGLWHEEIAHGIKPMHDALAVVLARHFGLAQPDDELHRLVIAVSALGVHLHLAHDVIHVVAPPLTPDPAAIDGWTHRLAAFAQAMVQSEAARRGLGEAQP